MVPGVLWRMKEKRLKDGKRDPRKLKLSTEGEKPAKRTDAWRPAKPGSIQKTGRGPKEHRFIVLDNGVEHHVFDPETSLHVGKHDKKIGVVYRFRDGLERFSASTGEYVSTTDRGLVPWDGTGGERGVRRAAAVVALHKGKVTKPTKSMIDGLCKPGAWGSQEFWKKLVEAHKEASDLGLLKEVMES